MLYDPICFETSTARENHFLAQLAIHSATGYVKKFVYVRIEPNNAMRT
jgi:hypothetical protein